MVHSDELARDNEVLHPHWGVLYKSGVYASKVTVLTPGGLPYAIASRLRLIAWLKGEQSTLTVWQESAEDIVGAFSFAGMDGTLRHVRETGGRMGINLEPRDGVLKVRTVLFMSLIGG